MIVMLSILLSSCLLDSIIIQGKQGIQGIPGQDGANGIDGKDGKDGVDGKDGIDGKDGTSLLNGNGKPSDALGKPGDSYIDLETWDFYVKIENAWVFQSNLKTSQEQESTSITNADLTLSGNASIDQNETVTLGGDSANKAFLNGDFQCSHFSMAAKFKIPEGSDFSFIIGKGSSYYGFWVELVNTNEKSYLNIYKDLLGNANAAPNTSCELDFCLQNETEYLIKLTFDIIIGSSPKKQMLIEILGESNEYYTYTTTCNAYGIPFYYSNADTCIVSSYNLSIDHYYNLENAQIAIFGHSFVEGDSLGFYRGEGFAYLLGNKLGDSTILNFGLGGDSISAMSNKISNSEKFIRNCDYALLCIGTNDRGMSETAFISKLTECIDKLKAMGIKPILFTIPHANYEMTDSMLRINDWIRSSGYHYVDMYKVFANSDGTCKTELFMADKIHPTTTGHSYIYHRIQFDCPFLF